MSNALRAPRQHAPAEQRRAQILAAALRCFADKGFHSATMDDLAQTAGLSKGSVYWHFRSKREVFMALYDAFEAEVFSAWDQEAAADASVLAVLRRAGEIVMERLGQESALLNAWPEFFTQRDARLRLARTYRRSRERIAALVRRGVARGELRDLPPEGVAALLTAAVEGLMLQAMVDPGFDPQSHWEATWEALYRGLVR